ncbi:hypothetical protein PM082_006096 [Marasmius tenuissimus]|nr:hypothetical protein PM082_006096 [Marasmius tenuissimus]
MARQSPQSSRKAFSRPSSPVPSTSSQISATQARPLPTVALQPGLEGQDDHIDTLISLYEEMQLASVEATYADFFQFVEKAFYFAAIREPQATPIAPSPLSPRSPPQSYVEWKKLNPFQDEDCGDDSDDDFEQPAEVGQDLTVTPYPLTLVASEGDASRVPIEQGPVEPTVKAGIQLPSDGIREEDEYMKTTDVTDGNFSTFEEYINNRYESKLLVTGASKGGSMLFDAPVTDLRHFLEPTAVRQTGRPAPSIWDTNMPPPDPIIGFVYLTQTQNNDAADASGLRELSIGIILRAEYRGKGYARAAVTEVLRYVFQHRNDCHRVQALIPENHHKNRAMNLFTQLQFGHEGTRRRCFYSFGEWKDITCLGILNTDWVMRSRFGTAPKSLWDEMFLRHDRERDELMQWEARKEFGGAILHRTSSMETIRDGKAGNTTEASGLASGLESESEIENWASDVASSQSKDKGKQKANSDSFSSPRAQHPSRISGATSHTNEYDSTPSDSHSMTGLLRSESPALSECSYSSASTGRSTYPPSTSSSSDWEMMDEDDYEIMSSLAEDEDDSDEEADLM